MSKVKLLSRVRLFATPWTVPYQAPPSMAFSRQEHWSGLPFSSPVPTMLLLLSHFSRVRLFTTPWTAAYQAPPSMAFSRQEYWSGLPLPTPYKGLHKINILYWLKSNNCVLKLN